jgi:hypothetical protein
MVFLPKARRRPAGKYEACLLIAEGEDTFLWTCANKIFEFEEDALTYARQTTHMMREAIQDVAARNGYVSKE